MATFSRTPNQSLIASGSVAASGTVAGTLDLSTKLGSTVLVTVTTGAAIAATNGATIQVFPVVDNTTPSTVPLAQVNTGTIAASTTVTTPIALQGGEKYQIKVTNLDASNAITVAAIYDTIDGIA